MIKKIVNFLKNDIVLVASWVLAIVSMFIVKPSREYWSYIDWRSLGILWSLMVIMEMLKTHGVFEYLGQKLLKKTKRIWQLVFVLILLCFVSGMFITNDVALITFVPFAIMLLEQCDRKKLIITVVVLQTIAANLGSMLTPIGNPQNLYLYGINDMSIPEFIGLTLPYAIVAFLLLAISVLFIKGKKDKVSIDDNINIKINKKPIVVLYLLIFALALATVARIIPFYVLIGIVLISTLICGKRIIVKVDYSLLFTFIGFFIFTGNMGRYEIVSDFLENIVCGHETYIAILVSQVISNVPAALLLSKFTDDINALIVGVNLGGLGTLIASMASLISFKLYAGIKYANKAKYMLTFSAISIVYLIILIGVNMVIY